MIRNPAQKDNPHDFRETLVRQLQALSPAGIASLLVALTDVLGPNPELHEIVMDLVKLEGNRRKKDSCELHFLDYVLKMLGGNGGN